MDIYENGVEEGLKSNGGGLYRYEKNKNKLT